MSGEAVLNNVDLARQLIGHAGTEILGASKAVRDPHGLCAAKYERWRRSGCREDTEEDRKCLKAVGGLRVRAVSRALHDDFFGPRMAGSDDQHPCA